MYSVSMNITPQIAEEFLKKNIENNRPLNVKRVAMLAEAMQNGEFYPNGNTIKFDTAGRLIDGQHRLSACVMAGVPFESIVVYDVDEKAFSVIDRNQQGRTQLQIHYMCGHNELLQNNGILAAVNSLGDYYGRNVRVSSDAQCSIFDQHKDAIEFLASCGAFYSSSTERRIEAPINAFLILAIENGYSKDDVNKFVKTYRCSDCYEGYGNKSVIQFRDRMKSTRKSFPRSTNGSLKGFYAFMQEIECVFNAYIRNAKRAIKSVENSILVDYVA